VQVQPQPAPQVQPQPTPQVQAGVATQEQERVQLAMIGPDPAAAPGVDDVLAFHTRRSARDQPALPLAAASLAMTAAALAVRRRAARDAPKVVVASPSIRLTRPVRRTRRSP
jgi:hypothetical protein